MAGACKKSKGGAGGETRQRHLRPILDFAVVPRVRRHPASPAFLRGTWSSFPATRRVVARVYARSDGRGCSRSCGDGPWAFRSRISVSFWTSTTPPPQCRTEQVGPQLFPPAVGGAWQTAGGTGGRDRNAGKRLRQPRGEAARAGRPAGRRCSAPRLERVEQAGPASAPGDRFWTRSVRPRTIAPRRAGPQGSE